MLTGESGSTKKNTKKPRTIPVVEMVHGSTDGIFLWTFKDVYDKFVAILLF